MKPVFQTIFSKTNGNCLQAAVASIFELPLEEVPHFISYGEAWLDKYKEFCMAHGVYPLYISAEGLDDPALLEGYYEMAVETERGLLHAVVGLKDKIVHDPFPEGSIVTKIVGYTIYVSMMGRNDAEAK